MGKFKAFMFLIYSSLIIINVWAQDCSGKVEFVDGSLVVNGKLTFYNNLNSSQRSSTYTYQNGLYHISVSNKTSNNVVYAYVIGIDYRKN